MSQVNAFAEAVNVAMREAMREAERDLTLHLEVQIAQGAGFDLTPEQQAWVDEKQAWTNRRRKQAVEERRRATMLGYLRGIGDPMLSAAADELEELWRAE